MSSRKPGEQSLEIEGKQYTFVMDLNGMAALEEMFSTPEREVSFNELVERVQRTGQLRYLRAFVWASLQHHHPEITLEQAGHLFTADTLVRMSALVSDVTKTMNADPADVKELELDRPRKARVNGRAGVSTGVTLKSPPASRA